MKVLKCDLCGRIYEKQEFEYTIEDHTTYHVNRTVHADVCRTCGQKLMAALNKKANNPSKSFAEVFSDVGRVD